MSSEPLHLQIVFLVLFLSVGWYLLRHRLSSSDVDNIPGPPSQSWINGNLSQLNNQGRAGWAFQLSLANEYGGTARLSGAFGEKIIYSSDPKVMHSALVKDQDVFEESDGFIHENGLIFGNGLLSTLGHHHRKQRKMLNPVFSAAHMRNMVPTFFEVTHKLENTLMKQLQTSSGDKNSVKEVDILSWLGRTAFELVGQSGLGHSFDNLSDENSAHPFSGIIKNLNHAQDAAILFARDYLLPSTIKLGPPGFRRFIVNILPWDNLHRIRDIADYMYSVATDIYQKKKILLEQGDDTVSQQIGRGKDIISVLMKENLKAESDDRLDDSELISQMSTLLFAAVDTTSSAMSRMIHLLAGNPGVQSKLREEVTEARRKNNNEDLSYEDLVALPYLDAVCRETLRLSSVWTRSYPPVAHVERVARQDAVVPLLKPIIGRNGAEMREIAVSRGTQVWVSILNSNRNRDLWGPDADEWKPERWLEPLPDVLLDAHIPGVYSHLMTFIGGGRSCIGFKFSQLEMKAVMSILLQKFEFSPSAQDSDVSWSIGGVSAPYVSGSPGQPQLPINMALVKE